MVVVEVNNDKGETIGAFRIIRHPEFEEELLVDEMVGDVSLADITFDHYFESDDLQVNIFMEE